MKVHFASPRKPKRLSSNFEASFGLTRESSSTYNSFPESNHVLAALQNKGNNKITELRTILQRESQNS